MYTWKKYLWGEYKLDCGESEQCKFCSDPSGLKHSDVLTSAEAVWSKGKRQASALKNVRKKHTAATVANWAKELI